MTVNMTGPAVVPAGTELTVTVLSKRVNMAEFEPNFTLVTLLDRGSELRRISTELLPAKGPESGETEIPVSPARDEGAERRVREVRRARPNWKRRFRGGEGSRVWIIVLWVTGIERRELSGGSTRMAWLLHSYGGLSCGKCDIFVNF